MRKTVIGIAALLCLTALVGCQNGQTSSSNSSADSSGQNQSDIENVVVNPGRATVYLSKQNTMQFSVVVTPETAANKAVVWSSSNTSVATIDQNGLVTCLSQGSTSIIAKSVADETKVGSATLIVKQYESQEDSLSSLDAPSFYETYKKNTQSLDSVEDINDASKNIPLTTFFKNAQKDKDPYRVGTDNPFKFEITGTVVDKDGNDSLVDDPHVLVKLAKYNETSKKYEDLDETALAEVATIALDKRSVDFKDAAVGKKYRIVIEADASAYSKLSAGYSPVNLDIEVVKGYNVYNKADLSIFDNSQTAWNDIKAQANLQDVKASGVILHSDITINNDDIPQAFKYSQQEVETYISSFGPDFANWCTMKGVSAAVGKDMLVGSLKDRTTIFRRDTLADQKDFYFEGNYFKLNCAGIKQIYAFGANSMKEGKVAEEYMPSDPTKGCEGSHAQLFGVNEFYGRGNNLESSVGDGKAVFKNATIISNGDLSNDDKYLGGLITFKFNTVNFVASNILTSKSFITFMAERNNLGIPDAETVMTLDRCKCFDSYNSMLYVWGSQKNYITNSIMKRAGGAIALLDEVGASDSANQNREERTPMVDCYNVDFDNPVTGGEPWFKAHKADSLVQMMALFGDASSGRWLGRNATLHGEHMNIMSVGQDAQGNPVGYVNLIAIDINGDDPLGNSLYTGGSMLRGHFNVYNDPEFTKVIGGIDMAKMAAANPLLGQATFVEQAVTEAMMNNNYLPTYRMMAANAGGAGIIAATNTGHAMLSDAPETEGGQMILSTGFRNGVIAAYNDQTMIAMGQGTQLNENFTLTPIPLYADNSGSGAETAASAPFSGRYTSTLDGLASGKYLSIYLQPDAGVEYLGAFIKMSSILG